LLAFGIGKVAEFDRGKVTSPKRGRRLFLMQFDLRRVAEYIRKADSEDLLDRVTIYRDGMEPAAVDLMEMELDRRGVTRYEIAEHDRVRRESAILLADGTAVRCSFCDRPAIMKRWGWHRLFGRVPIFPMVFAYCDAHAQ